ncbi:MAG: hypothetical protein AB1757_19445 [Acidobacteriota bacterium]
MTNLNYSRLAYLFISLLIFFSACKSSGGEIPNDLADLLKRNAVKEYKTDFSYETPEIPDKKYLSLTVVHSFSSADGEPQKEHLGYILKKENGEWKVEKNTSYTLKADKAKGLLRGEK